MRALFNSPSREVLIPIVELVSDLDETRALSNEIHGILLWIAISLVLVAKHDLRCLEDGVHSLNYGVDHLLVVLLVIIL